jgi:diguanylate cyclase (GGDEF)-like protein
MDHHTLEYRFKHKKGMYIWVQDGMKLTRNNEGKPLEFIGYLVDISQRKELEMQLLHDSLHDSLTDLPNRALFLDRLEFFMTRARRLKDSSFAVLFLDTDRFKNVNDSLGHMAGDMILTVITQRLKKCLRPDDMVARLGGDEFAILIDDIKDIKYVKQVSERIHEEMKAPFNVKNQVVYLSTSIGIAVNDRHYDLPEQLLRDADIAMYQAKAYGGACHVVFDKSMHKKAVTRLQLESDLIHAVENKKLSVCYQAIMESETTRVVGFEALLRWEHPVHGLISPAEFIPLAEETGLILPIGEWVLYEACRDVSRWQKQFPVNSDLTVSVNISSKQFSPQLIGLVKNVLWETGIKTGSLNLEITESLLMENAEFVDDLLSQLKEMNVYMHIDDFGTGYSSLSYLHRFPIDALKIDRSFVRMIGHINNKGEEKMEVIKAIITLAHSLNMDVIAEGVESETQVQTLRALNCKYLQGFFFSKPLDSKAVERFFQQNQALI